MKYVMKAEMIDVDIIDFYFQLEYVQVVFLIENYT